ncbi:deoxynucleotidyltransferase terminal-interacting protein 1 [Diabrotica virgifera virgifera]|uniref:Deoxynucleotidyltransferase terminal-interacting protein 1 n=1 Tax=Diabrotica virgifera virgifera TaxID=50390 RepID=A0A6P7G2G9_DIAVI|nr:deoxynucleotidyltransferase terminal-interacting protein 1 [Diabrotica virgifera virgifera]
MIPPVAPGQTEEKLNMVGWKNTFNMRQISLMNLAASQLSMKNGAKSLIPSYRRAYSVTSPSKSLDILRKNLQNAINKDIDNVLKKYIEKFFQPAINNIRNNVGKDSVGDDHIKEVCKTMLEEAKLMYKVSPHSRDNSPYECYQSEGESEASLTDLRMGMNSPIICCKRKDCDPDAEIIPSPAAPTKKPRNKTTHSTDYSSCKLSWKRDGPKWNPDRLRANTLFIMGARANKVLGYGQTRGRLYVRHPNLVRYSGDQEDKEWLASKNLMPPSGGKAYLMLLEDIKELTVSDEYKYNANLQLHELKGFEVPLFLLIKIKNFIEYVRNERKLLANVDPFEDQCDPNISSTPHSVAIDSAPSTPSDTTLIVENTSEITFKTDFLNMSSDMSNNLTSSVISSILSGHLTTMNGPDTSQDF